ncbi:hypothetical protein QQF64_034403, partial [Cirrhinus molitorella]
TLTLQRGIDGLHGWGVNYRNKITGIKWIGAHLDVTDYRDHERKSAPPAVNQS